MFFTDSGTGTIRRQEYYSPIIDTESLLFSLLKQGKWRLNTPSAYTSQEMVVALPEGKENAREHSCDTIGGCENCGDCCATCGGKSGVIDDKHHSAIIDSSSALSSTTLTPCTSTNTITSATFNSNKEDKKRDTEPVFQTRKSFRKSSLQCTKITAGNNHKKLHRALTTANACSVNISSIMAQSQQSLSSASAPPLLRQQRNSVMSSTSSLSSENSSSNSSKTRRKIVSRLAKRLREECDKILGSSESLLIDWRMLSAALKEISKEEGRFGVEDGSISSDDAKYQDLVMFLADLFKYTPTLGITYTAESKPESSELTSTIDLRRFHNVKFLELKKVSPRTISNLKMIKRSLTTLKCARCIETIGQILTEPLMTEAGSSITADKKLSCIWPELKDLDLSSNQIDTIDGSAVEAFDLCPMVATLNLSRNRISSIDDSFARTLNSLSIINLTYNQLKAIPPIPPNVKVLILAHNYITSLSNNQNNNRNLETFISQVGPYRNLEILDLSSNLIASDSSFRVLRDISTLKHISLDGNPISYLESYRNNVLSYLNKLAISRHFTLDKKRLSSTEVKYAIEQSKKCKYVPQFSSMTSPHSHQPMSTSLMTTSSQTISSTSRPSPLSHLTSLTQSFESNSSSLRSSRRKKPKIREISSIDFNESYNENVSPSGGEDNESIIRVPLERPGSSLSEHGRRSILVDSGLEQTCATIKALRNKYGADNWLLHQHPGRSEVSKIICIPENKPFMEYNPSKSLPSHPERRNTGRRNSCSRCEGFNSNTNNYDSNEKNSSDGISVVASHNTSSVEGSDISSYSDVYSTNFTSKLHSSGAIRSNQSSSALADGSGANLNEKGGDSNSPPTSTTGEEGRSKNSIFDMNTDYMEEKFPEQSDNSSYFRIFMHGQYHNLICFNGFLFEVDPHDSTIYHKWDLNSLISLEEEKCDSETETVEFRLIFNTMRKQMREKSFIMCAKEFAKFDKLVSPYIEKKMMEEFIEALQCTRCQAQFSKAMASKTVKHEKGKAPREVLVCPDPACGNEFLVTLDTIPLPNNECLELDRGSLENSIPVPLRTSTPSGKKRLISSVLLFGLVLYICICVFCVLAD